MELVIKEYLDYYYKTWERLKLYKSVSEAYGIKKALYPGSHIDITPSLVIPKVTYIDNFKGSAKFFKHDLEIKSYLNQHKHYNEACKIQFYSLDYNQISMLNLAPVQLVISQYAGFVGQATKKYLQLEGLLLCNDSHGDATLAYLDSDFKLIATVNNQGVIDQKNLDKYFKLKNNQKINDEEVKLNMRGLKYIEMADNYLFQRIN